MDSGTRLPELKVVLVYLGSYKCYTIDLVAYKQQKQQKFISHGSRG